MLLLFQTCVYLDFEYGNKYLDVPSYFSAWWQLEERTSWYYKSSTTRLVLHVEYYTVSATSRVLHVGRYMSNTVSKVFQVENCKLSTTG